jgi:hypothetical protein
MLTKSDIAQMTDGQRELLREGGKLKTAEILRALRQLFKEAEANPKIATQYLVGIEDAMNKVEELR